MKISLHPLQFCFVIFFIIIFSSSSLETTNIESEKITIKVGYDKDYGVIDDSLSLDSRGFGYDVLMRSEHYSDFVFEFYEYDYWEALEALDKGEIDLMGVMFDSKIYRERYEYIPTVLGTTQLILATKNNEIYYDDPDSLNGKTVSSYAGNPYERYLNDYCEKNDISITYVHGTIKDFVDLEADYYLITTIDNKAKHLKMVLNLEVFNMYFIASKNNSELAYDIDDAIRFAVSADGNFLKELQIKYYGSKNLTRRYLTRSEMNLLSSRTLTCGYIDHHQPIQFTNDKNQADGISVQVMNLLSEKYGFNIKYVPYNHDMPNESHESFDMLISATGDFAHEMKYYSPSNPFMTLPMMLFAEKQYIDQIVSEDISSVIGMLNYITLDYTDINKRYPNNEVRSYDTFDDLLTAFINREIDGLLATENGVEYAQAVLGEEYYSIRSTALSLPLRVFFSRNLDSLTEYLGAFNIMFEHLERARIDEVMAMQSVRFLPEYSASIFIQENFVLLVTVFLLILLVIISMFYFQQHEKKKVVLDILNNDNLTSLISLYYFSSQAKAILQGAKPNEYEVILVDIDSFRTINTIYTKMKGDLIIKSVASALEQAYAGTNTLISRIIADQFVIFHKINEGEKLEKVCEHFISNAIKSVMGEKYNFSLSVGICIIQDTSLSIDTIIDQAIAAHLKGKSKYKITYITYDEGIENELKLKNNIVLRMKDALINNEFKVFFQPKIAFDTLKIGGAEALVRWFDNNNKVVSYPDIFIKIFEANGFIVNLDLYVFEEVCKFIVENEKQYSIPLISVNVSTVTLFDDKFPIAYFTIMKKYGLSPRKIELEITESAMTLDQKILIEKAKQIRSVGLYLSIDDFGTGESSLNRLNTMVADTIKLDKAFLDYNLAEKRGTIVVNTVVQMAKQLNMNVVSEGVETIEQVKWLTSLNCDYAQGYYFEKPMSQNRFKDLLREDKKYHIGT